MADEIVAIAAGESRNPPPRARRNAPVRGLTAAQQRDLDARPVAPGARRIYNKAFKMPERPRRAE